MNRMTRDQMAERVARDIPEGYGHEDRDDPLLREDRPAAQAGADDEQLPGLWPGGAWPTVLYPSCPRPWVSLDQVRALLSISGDRSCDCAGIDRIAKEHLLEVDRKLADLGALRKELKAVIDSCDGGIVADCRIVEALGPVPPG